MPRRNFHEVFSSNNSEENASSNLSLDELYNLVYNASTSNLYTSYRANELYDSISRAYAPNCNTIDTEPISNVRSTEAWGGEGSLNEYTNDGWTVSFETDASTATATRGQYVRDTISETRTDLSERYGDEISFVDVKDVHPGVFAVQTDRRHIAKNFLFLYEKFSNSKFCFLDTRGNAVGYAEDELEKLVFFVSNSLMLDRYFSKISENIEQGYTEENIDVLVEKLRQKYHDRVDALNLKKCKSCGKITARGVAISDTEYVCRECFYKDYFYCSRCGKAEKKTAGHSTREGRVLCAECGKRHYVLPYHRDYPEVRFYGDSKSNSVPYMGFELEVDRGGESARNVSQIMPLINKEEKGEIFAYCSHDSSIRDGFEIITQPATMEYHNSIKDVYNRTIQKLKSMGYISHESSTCGLHVHVNRDFFTPSLESKSLYNLILMFNKFWNELCVYARRPEWRSARYAKHLPEAEDEIETYLRRANKSGSHNYHYYALNISNENTIEFRMFRGSLNINTVMATLQLVNNMVIFAKSMASDDVKRMKFDELLTTKNQRRYWNRRKAVLDFEE